VGVAGVQESMSQQPSLRVSRYPRWRTWRAARQGGAPAGWGISGESISNMPPHGAGNQSTHPGSYKCMHLCRATRFFQ